MENKKNFYIDGKWVPPKSKKEIKVVNPATEENCAVMAVNQMTEFLQTGNIRNSVNFPNVHLKRTTDHRVSIINKNVPAMIGQIATELGELNLNIAEMTNVSKGDIAYNLIDIENEVSEESIAKLKAIENVIDVRLIG